MGASRGRVERVGTSGELERSRWQEEWERVRRSGNEWERVRTSGNEWKRVETSGNEWEEVGRSGERGGACSSLGADDPQSETHETPAEHVLQQLTSEETRTVGCLGRREIMIMRTGRRQRSLQQS